jgi:hypothetical protein
MIKYRAVGGFRVRNPIVCSTCAAEGNGQNNSLHLEIYDSNKPNPLNMRSIILFCIKCELRREMCDTLLSTRQWDISWLSQRFWLLKNYSAPWS